MVPDPAAPPRMECPTASSPGRAHWSCYCIRDTVSRKCAVRPDDSAATAGGPIAMYMKAYRLLKWGQQPELMEVPVPEPGPGQVLLKMGGAGACHSDLHLMARTEATAFYKAGFTLGQENAGWMARLGQGVKGFR